jgi:hypothetical protein
MSSLAFLVDVHTCLVSIRVKRTVVSAVVVAENRTCKQEVIFEEGWLKSTTKRLDLWPFLLMFTRV